MKLQTQIPLEKQNDNQIGYHSKLLLLGSCFVENIGKKLEYFKFQNLQNPFGILFHPKAIETLVNNAIKGKQYTEEDIFFYNEQWHCNDAHTKLSDSSKEQLLQNLNQAITSTYLKLQDATHIIITLGTAWVYKSYKTNLPVANCHKVAQKEFVKQLLTAEEITNSLKVMVEQIHHVNPSVSVIFTVSPVRHIKDGYVENSQSKAHLITAIHQFLSHRTESKCFYFPSYEIMLDELRDYRFYNEDMLHPNAVAIDYIWRKFQHVWITPEAEKTMETVDGIRKGLQHRPFNPNSESHEQFVKKLARKSLKLQQEFPHITF